ncbi:DUF397 domain-containing protein [Streptomyces sp. SJL17-4]|uniref:DUF397 domain-containing protein n=1 Tax=Streptomyces sp. SJL17-4 TaxID=2967224 RepID=UPI0030CBB55D
MFAVQHDQRDQHDQLDQPDQHDPAEPVWRSSSYSSGNGQCVEVMDDPHGTVPVPVPVRIRIRIRIRDSKTAPAGPRLAFGDGAWTSFVDAVRTERL